ncbi:MAG: ribosome biogenesis GTP-binding protein YihA/YsxC [Gemmatimonadota bacterium]|nr:ribosome biogenesis GTP-binding protein YihA/YsxC [Gemmatimonadota bacterium]
MKITSAEFVGAVAKPGQPPPDHLPEIAVAGRSNVGKSSLINAFLGRKKLARISKQPGRTREINFFRINDRFHLVDLPGYGYANAPEEVRRAWGRLVESYLSGSQQLRGVVMLVDARRGIRDEDRRLCRLIEEAGAPALLVLTKIDKLSWSARAAAVERARLDAGLPEDQVLATSAKTREGIPDLLASVEALLTEG